MNLILKCEGFYENIIERRKHLGGIQYLFIFDNGYGASVVKHRGSYGFEEDLWELAVIEYLDNESRRICYDTDITDDVLGYLRDDEVVEILQRIKELI